MNPKEYKQMMDYLTRSGIKKQIKFASDIARPDPKPVVKEIELFNEFNKRNPRADGGRIGFQQGTPQRLSLINNLKSTITEAKKTNNYGLLKAARRDTGGVLSEQTAKFLNQADPSSEFYKGKEFANKFAKDLGISTKKLNSLLDKRSAAIREYRREASQKSSLKRVDPLKIKMINLINEGVKDTSELAKKLKVSKSKVNQLGNALYKNVYANSSAIGMGATKQTSGLATFLPDNAKDLNSLLKKMHNVKGLETVEQRQIKKILGEAFGGGKNPELFKLYNNKINEYYNIKKKLAGTINLNLDHPLSSQMIKNLKLGKEAMLFVEPLTAEINQGTKALLDKTYAKAFDKGDTAKMKAVVNLSKKIELPIGTTKTISEPFYKQDIPKKIIQAAETQNRILRNIKNLPKEEIQKVFKDKRTKLISPDVKPINVKGLSAFMKGLGIKCRLANGVNCNMPQAYQKSIDQLTQKAKQGDEAARATLTNFTNKAATAGRFIKNALGPLAIASELAIEGGIALNKTLQTGVPLKTAFADSIFNLALGPDYRIDKEAELKKEFAKGEDFAMAERGRRMFLPQSATADAQRQKERMDEMISLYPQYSDQQLTSMLEAAGYNPQDVINQRTTTRITPAVTSTLTGLDQLRTAFQEQNALQRIADAGGVANLAGGGIAKEAGDPSGAMLESMNPDSQGLPSLLKRGRKG